jgi:hypothetical protein
MSQSIGAKIVPTWCTWKTGWFAGFGGTAVEGRPPESGGCWSRRVSTRRLMAA